LHILITAYHISNFLLAAASRDATTKIDSHYKCKERDKPKHFGYDRFSGA